MMVSNPSCCHKSQQSGVGHSSAAPVPAAATAPAVAPAAAAAAAAAATPAAAAAATPAAATPAFSSSAATTAAPRSHRFDGRRPRALDVATAAAATAVALMLPSAVLSLQVVTSVQRRAPMPRGHGVRLQERTLRGWKRKGSLDCIGWSQRCQGGGGLGLGNLFSGSNVRAAATGKGGDGSAVSMSLKMPPSSSSSPTSSSTSSSGGLLDGSDGGCGGESSASSLRSPLSTGNGNGGGDGVGGVGAMAKSSAIDPAEDSNRLGREKDSTKGERKGWGLNWRDHKKKNKSKSREKNESRVSGATALAGGEQEHQQQGGKEDGEGGTKRKGPFTYDWENGGRVKWVANKESKAIVVSSETDREASHAMKGCRISILSS